MDGFTILDGVVFLVVILSALLAYGRGVLRETMAIVGWIAAALLAFTFAPVVQPLVAEIPVVGGFLDDSCELSVIAAFAIVFAIGLVVFSIFTPLLSSMIRDSAIGPIDQGFGFLFGVARGVILVAIALVVYDRVNIGDGITIVEQSRTAVAFEALTGQVEEAMPDEAPAWIVGRYEGLVGACG